MCRFRAPVDLLAAWKRPLEGVEGSVWTADRPAVEDGLLCHRSFPETAGLGRPTQQERERNCG